MAWRCGAVVAGLGMLCAPSERAWAQERTVASLPFAFGQTAGPNITNYEPPDDARDLWAVEDFGIPAGVYLTRFESYGTIFPTPLFVHDVTVEIRDALPPGGNTILRSIPGTGRIIVSGFDYRLAADFQLQHLPAGSYYLLWNASTRSGQGQIAIQWAQGGPHAVGAGQADNAWQWNPGGGWGFPGNIRPVPAQLGGGGQTGVNFTLFGADCYANCDGSTSPPILNVNDFVCFQSRFAAGHPAANCDLSTSPPILNINDFVCFMGKYAAGCP